MENHQNYNIRYSWITHPIIAVDFDGTVVDHRFPLVGEDVPYAVDVMKMLVSSDYNLILYTMRSGDTLQQAVEWFLSKEVHLLAVNENPTQSEWTTSNKCFAHVYIDDSAFGCPMIFPPGFNRPCVDWRAIAMRFLIK